MSPLEVELLLKRVPTSGSTLRLRERPEATRTPKPNGRIVNDFPPIRRDPNGLPRIVPKIEEEILVGSWGEADVDTPLVPIVDGDCGQHVHSIGRALTTQGRGLCRIHQSSKPGTKGARAHTERPSLTMLTEHIGVGLTVRIVPQLSP